MTREKPRTEDRFIDLPVNFRIGRRMNLDILLEERDVGILCLTETWLTDEVRNSEIFLNRQFFVQSRKNRKVGTHVGTLITHNTSLCFNQATEIETNFDFYDVKLIS